MSKKLLGLLLLWILVSVRHVESRLMEKLPASRSQVISLAKDVCYELEDYLVNQTSRKSCEENFWKPDASLSSERSALKIRCRSETNIRFEVPELDIWQLVVLIPEMITETDDVENIKFSLVEPNVTFSEINWIETNIKYLIYSAVVNNIGRLSMWKEEGELPLWIHEPRDYNIKTQFLHYNDSKLDRVVGVFTWNQTGDLDACFDFINFCQKSGRTVTEVWSDSLPTMKIKEMHLKDECLLTIKGLHGSTEMNYHTPSSTEDIPDIPQNVSIVALEEGGGWSVIVKWSKPTNAPDLYHITLRADRIDTLVLNGKATTVIFHNVMGEGLYDVSIYAKKGDYTSQISTRAIFPGRSQWRWVSLVGATWCGVGLAISAAAMCWLRLRKRIYAIEKPQQKQIKKKCQRRDTFNAECSETVEDVKLKIEAKPLEDSCPESVVTESWCDDEWEVKEERLELHQIIGEGAFGIVRKGTLAPFGREVAVKMLRDYPTLDEIRSFRLETELMKSVGGHPHVVSLLGCCSGKRPLIIAEYCSRGDLLSFLRCSWDVMISKRNMKYHNNNSAEYRSDLFRFPTQTENLVVNKLYDMQGICESELTSRDLLSFCRQIAMGMEFLASNRLVHRDLAARNILVTGDRTLKIADFGLSRDVYEENQYKQKGNGKMPVKWMALESLTRRIYTTQSDVWSFGIVVWEVVTLGGAPYADVPAARLTRLLRAGYRMPRPANCSKQLYDVMLSCWRAEPRARPTFSTLHVRLDELLNSACADDYLCLELDDTPSPPTPKHQRYFRILLRAKRAWTRGETYERPLKAPQSNHYTSSPMTLARTPV